MLFVIINFILGYSLPIVLSITQLLVASTASLLDHEFYVLFRYNVMCSMTQRFKIDPKLAYLESTHQELSNEV
mgnify:FL=1